MRIALTYPEVALTGGVERVVVHAANHLAGRGHDVTVFATTVAPGVLDRAVTVVDVPAGRGPEPRRALAYRRNATRALAAAPAFDVHGSFSALSPLGGVYWTPSVHRSAYLEAVRRRDALGALAVRANPFHRVRLRLEREAFAAEGYARVVVQTPELGREVAEHYGVPGNDIEVVPLGVDVDAFSPVRRAAARSAARRAHGFADADRVVAFVANELERKGYDTLLESVERLDERTRLLVVGRMRPPEHPRVTWAGATDDVLGQLAAADAFALPTRYEPWGLVIIEALAAGLPVVTTRLAGASEAVQEERTGVLLDDAHDVDALTDGLRWALGDAPAAAEEIAASVAPYAWDEVLSRYENVLAAVAARSGATAGATAVAAPKPLGYYGAARADLVAELPTPLGRVLDVGCGAGGVGRSLRAAGASEIVGIEVVPEAAAEAESVFDHVVVATVEEALASGAVQGPFDTICCYDVLEHLVDPERVLRSLRPLAAPGGRVHVSCPNARHFSLVKDLVLRGTFGYTEYGHRDATHLRWFTRTDLMALVEQAGFRVTGVAPNTFAGRDRPFDRLTLGRTREFIALQWHVLGVAD